MGDDERVFKSSSLIAFIRPVAITAIGDIVSTMKRPVGVARHDKAREVSARGAGIPAQLPAAKSLSEYSTVFDTARVLRSAET